MNGGLFSQVAQWITHPYFSEGEPVDWLAFAVVLLLLGFLWMKVLRHITGDL